MSVLWKHFLPSEGHFAGCLREEKECAYCKEKALRWAIGLGIVGASAEAMGGYLTKSVSLLADAAHLGLDTGGFFIGILALRHAKKESIWRVSMALFLLVAILWILFHAFGRGQEEVLLQSPEYFFPVALGGLLVNIVTLLLLHRLKPKGEDRVWGANFWHTASDLGVSLTVIVVGVVSYSWPATPWIVLVDPLVASLIALFLGYQIWLLLRGHEHHHH